MKVGDKVTYRNYNRWGDEVNSHVRSFNKRLLNEKGNVIFEWRDEKGDIGICLPSTWEEWRAGSDESMRRTITDWHGSA